MFDASTHTLSAADPPASSEPIYLNITVTRGEESITAERSITFASTITLLNQGALLAGRAQDAYTTQLSASGGFGPKTFSLGEGSYLPAGLQLLPSGEISGTPTIGSPDPFPLVINATDAHGRTGTGSFTLLIAPPPPPPLMVTINGSSFSTVVGKPISIPATASGGVAPLVLSDTEFTFATPGTKTATVTVTDANNSTASDSVEVEVRPLEISVAGDEAIVRQGDFAAVTFSANDDSGETQVVDTASTGEKFHSWTHPSGVTAYATVFVTPNYASLPILNPGNGVGGMLPNPPNPAVTSAPAAPGAFWEYRSISKSSGKVSGSWHDLYLAWSKSGGKSSMVVVQEGSGQINVSGTKWKTSDPEVQQTTDDDALPELDSLAWSPGFGGANKSRPLSGSLHRILDVPGINRKPPPTVPYNYAEFEATGTVNNVQQESHSQVRLRRQPGTPEDVAITVTYLLLITTKDGDTETSEVQTGTATIAANEELSSIIDLTAEPGQSKTLLPIEFITPAGDPVKSPVDAGTSPSSIPDGANEFTFSEANNGVLTMKLKAKVPGIGSMSSADQAKFTFELDKVGDSTFAWDASNADGKATVSGDYITATATFTGLPKKNSDFGLKKARIKHSGNNAGEASFEVFFPLRASNHPEGESASPNWYHYWKQLVPSHNMEFGGTPSRQTTAEVKAMNFWSYYLAKDKTLITIYTGVLGKFKGYEVGEEFSGIDRFIGSVLHEAKHVDQIARADNLIPTGQAQSPWRNGWSFNFTGGHNHWTKGADGKPGVAGVDDDGDGTIDNLIDSGPGELGSGDDVNLTHPSAESKNWPSSWPIPSPLIYPKSEIESEAINYSDQQHDEHKRARDDWGNPGKNHKTINNWDD